MPYWTDILAFNPVHAWRMNGSSIDEGVGTALNGTDTGIVYETPLFSEDTSSAHFERGTDAIAFATSTDLDNMVVTQRTFSCLIQPTLDTLPFGIFSTGNFDIFLAGGMVPAIVINDGVSNVVLYGRALTINETANLVCTYNAGVIRIFIDGKEVATRADAPTSIPATTGGSTTDPFTVGLSNAINHTVYNYSGFLSNMAVWNSVISDVNIFNTLFLGGATSKLANAAFTNIPDKTEVRMFDINAGLVEIDIGKEYAASMPDLSLSYSVVDSLLVRLVIMNVEDRFLTFYSDIELQREGVSFPVDLLLKQDRVYDNDWLQAFPPINTSAPQITGIKTVGSLLTCSDGTWTGTPVITFTYQWQRDSVDIIGETNNTYTITVADDSTFLTCIVTASNSIGSVSQASNPFGIFAGGIIGIWNHTAGLGVTTVFATMSLDVETRNTDSFYTQSANEVTLPAGRYLVIYQMMWFASGLNNRGNIIAKLQKDQIDIAGSFGSGYQRDTANDAAWATGMAIVDSDGTNSVRVQAARDTDVSVGALNNIRSNLQIIKVNEGTGFGHYNTGDNGASFAAANYAQVALGATLTESGNSVTRNVDQIDLSANTNYLVVSGLYFNVTSDRIAKFNKVDLDGVVVSGSIGYAYLRNTSDQFGSPNSVCLVQTGASPQSLTISARGANNSSGTAGTGGSLVAANSGLFVLELTSNVYKSSDNIGAQQLSVGGSVSINFNETIDQANSTIFSSTTLNSATFGTTSDLFMSIGVYQQRQVSEPTRWTRECVMKADGVRIEEIQHGAYNRGDQGTQDTFDSAINPRGIYTPSAVGEVLTIDVTEELDVAWQEGGGNLQTEADEPVGFFAIDLSTI